MIKDTLHWYFSLQKTIFTYNFKTMRVRFMFGESEIIYNFIEIEMDWNCPFLPRLGEVISPSILMLKLSPKEFYEALTEEAKIEWNDNIKKEMDYYDENIEEAEKDCMTEWLLNMSMCVKGIFWDVDEKGYNVIFSIAETYNILE